MATLQVNARDYRGIVRIEDAEAGSVPAWDERGQPDLCGPFATAQEAVDLLREQQEYLEWCGYTVVLAPIE